MRKYRMNLEFKELSKSRSAKLRKVILLNSVLLPATVLGFVYLPDLLQANINGAGKLMAAVGMGPAIETKSRSLGPRRECQHFRAQV